MGAWGYLALAVLLEAGWVIGLRFTENWSRFLPSAFVVLCYALCLVPLSFATRTLTPSIAYSVWVGGGVALVASVDLLWFDEPFSYSRLIFITLILIGVIGLHSISRT